MEKRKKKNLITYLIIGASCLVVGGTLGIVGKKVLGQEIVDDSGFNPEKYKADSAALLKRYENYTGSTPEKEFTQTELVNIALEKYRRCEYSYSVGIGLANAVAVGVNVMQEIKAAQVRNGDTYFEESVSKSSMVGCAYRSMQVGKDGELDSYEGTSISDDASHASYAYAPKHYTHDGYKKAWGKTLDEMFIYIVSGKTVMSTEQLTKDGSNYVITLNLNVDTSTYYYKYQMVTISGLSSRPVFTLEKLTYVLTKDLDLVSLKCEEAYSASMAGISATTTATLNYYYFPNYEIKIPELNERIDYSMEGLR